MSLDLSGNQLTSVPMELGGLVNLKELAMQKNPELTSVPAEWAEAGTYNRPFLSSN
jgi:Leucine-rich repeat (LRR) protein